MSLRPHITFLTRLATFLPLFATIAAFGQQSAGTFRIAGSVTAGSVMVDGSGVGDIGNVVLRDRKLLSEDGIFTVVITLNKQTGALLAQPEILSRGFVYEKNSEELLKETRELVKAKAAQFEKNHRSSWSSIKNDIRNSIKNYLYERTKRRPMVMPIIIEI